MLLRGYGYGCNTRSEYSDELHWAPNFPTELSHINSDSTESQDERGSGLAQHALQQRHVLGFGLSFAIRDPNIAQSAFDESVGPLFTPFTALLANANHAIMARRTAHSRTCLKRPSSASVEAEACCP